MGTGHFDQQIQYFDDGTTWIQYFGHGFGSKMCCSQESKGVIKLLCSLEDQWLKSIIQSLI